MQQPGIETPRPVVLPYHAGGRQVLIAMRSVLHWKGSSRRQLGSKYLCRPLELAHVLVGRDAGVDEEVTTMDTARKYRNELD